MRVGNLDYISLTDLTRYINPNDPKLPIHTWFRNKNVISFWFFRYVINYNNAL